MQPFPGFEVNTSNSRPAQKIQNIRRSLEYLAEHNKRIPLTTLACEEDMLHGELKRVFELFIKLKKVYMYHK